MSKFTIFYKLKEPRRDLHWLFLQGTCEIKTNHLAKSFHLITTVIQYSILDIFNKKDQISYSELKSLLKISNEDLQNNLKFLAVPSRPFIIKENSKTTAFTDDEKISINNKFNFKYLKVELIPQAAKSQEIPAQNEKIVNEINIGRAIILDCIFVRILKGRKSELYNILITEVIHQCTLFKPDIQLIKQRIESLMEREFLARDSANRDLIVYLP